MNYQLHMNWNAGGGAIVHTITASSNPLAVRKAIAFMSTYPLTEQAKTAVLCRVLRGGQTQQIHRWNLSLEIVVSNPKT